MVKFKDIPKYCVNLKKRPDRWAAVQKEFKKHNLNIRKWGAVNGDELTIPIISAKAHEYNAKYIMACMLSHINLIRHAQAQQFEYILIFEDDIIIADDFWKRMKYIENLKLDFDMFYLGGHFRNEDDIKPTKNKYIYRCNYISGTYAYILKDTIYNFILNRCDYNYGIDEFYEKVVQKRRGVYGFIPFLVDHLGGISDVAQKIVDYPLAHANFKNKI